MILGPRILHTLHDNIPEISDKYAGEIRDIISDHLTHINITHRVTVYATNHEPEILFLKLIDVFPQDLISTLVSLLATQDVTPPLRPPDPLPIIYEW